jgi:tetratricopeptide (TPR) repeat protein
LAQYEASVESVKDLFAQRKFKEVIIKVNQLLEMNIVSPSILSLYFILAESYYQTHELDQCFATARRMVELFPEEEKTGYVLLRVGMFLQEKNRVEEAKNMFALVGQAFSGYADLKDKSERFLGTVVTGREQ